MPVPSLDRRFAYGLRFGCDFPLPELPLDPAASGKPDVRIELAAPLSRDETEALLAPDAPLSGVLSFEERRCHLLFSEVGRFTVYDGERVTIEPLEHTDEAAWRLPLLGSILALTLEMRGLFALHGGAARFLDNRGEPVAAGFLGDKGAGKSTLNAALAHSGHPLFCDDVLAVEPASLLALPGFATLKLAPDAVAGVLHRSPTEFASVAPGVVTMSKRSVSVPLASAPAPLRHLFVLGWSDEGDPEPVRVRRLSAAQALSDLFPHTFAARFSTLFLTGERRATHFRALARLCSACAVWSLERRRDLELLPLVCDAVERVVCAQGSPMPKNDQQRQEGALAGEGRAS